MDDEGKRGRKMMSPDRDTLAAMPASTPVGATVAVELGNGGGSSRGVLWVMGLSEIVISLGEIIVGTPVIPLASL